MLPLINTNCFQLKIKSEDFNILKERFESVCDKWRPNKPIIYAITPTYKRPVQKAELTRYNKVHELYLIIMSYISV